MSLASLLRDLPLWSPIGLPPKNSEIIVLCAHNDIQYLPNIFSRHNIKTIITDSLQEQEAALNKNYAIDTDFIKILNFPRCYIALFSSEPNFEILHWFYLKLAEIKIRHAYICMPLPRSLTTVTHYSPTFFNRHRDELEQVYNLLSDDESRIIFASRLKSILIGNIGYLKQSKYPQYFHPAVLPQPGDIILDGGVSGNISIEEEFLQFIGGEGHIYAFEPEPVCYVQAYNKVESIKNMTLLPLGMWNKCEEIYFASEGAGSHVLDGEPVEHCVACDMTTIDTIVSQYNINKVDVIKLDVEGSEEKALLGGIKTIVKHRPKLLISLYHKPRDIFELPLFINKLNLDYKFYLGHHRPSLQETVLYARPDKRRVKRHLSLSRRDSAAAKPP